MLDLHKSRVLGNGIDGILAGLNLTHALHTQDYNLLLQIVKTVLNPRVIKAVRA